MKDKTDTADGTPVKFNFGRVTFTKPGEYVYDITEVIPTDNQDKIPGVSYDGSFYRVTVTIEDDGSGQLKMKDATIQKTSTDDITTKVQEVTFTNTFKDDTETLVIETKKLYKDAERKPMALTYGQFQFELKPATENEYKQALDNNTDIPMPSNAVGNVASTVNNANGDITFAPITYSLANRNEGNTW